MNEQLKRIRQKDYSQIDQALFQNMAKTDNLSSTLSHLSQFQQFLMQQIKLLNHQKSNQTASLTCSINKNFDTLRESLVNCSRIQHQNQQNSGRASVRKTLSQVKEAVLMTKVEVKGQISRVCKQTQQIAQNALKEVLAVLEEQRIVRKALQQKCKILQLQRDTLAKEKQELSNNKKEETINSFRTQTPKDSAGHNHRNSIHRSTTLTKEESNHNHSCKNLFQPLTQQKCSSYNYHAFNSIPSFSQKQWKISRQNAMIEQRLEPRRHSLSRQTSNHKLASKQNLNLLKQNQILLSKGVRDQRRKSKQKIKIFSLM